MERGRAGTRGIEIQAVFGGDEMVGLDCCCVNSVFLRLVRREEDEGWWALWWRGRLRDLRPRDAREKSLLAWEEMKLLYGTISTWLMSKKLARYC